MPFIAHIKQLKCNRLIEQPKLAIDNRVSERHAEGEKSVNWSESATWLTRSIPHSAFFAPAITQQTTKLFPRSVVVSNAQIHPSACGSMPYKALVHVPLISMWQLRSINRGPWYSCAEAIYIGRTVLWLPNLLPFSQVVNIVAADGKYTNSPGPVARTEHNHNLYDAEDVVVREKCERERERNRLN